MDLREAYDELEIEQGASEEAVKDARNTLAKVWHPDKHANDPALQKKAQLKLASVNEAFDAIKRAGFPKGKADAKPKAAPKPEPKAEPKRPEPPKPEPKIEFVTRRRLRWPVVLLIIAAIGVGAYFAVVKLGSPAHAKPDAGVVAQIDAAAPDAAVIVETPDAAVVVEPTSDAAEPKPTGKTFGLGSTHDEVTAAQGKPTKTSTVIDEEWQYGFSVVTFNKRGKVVAWWDRDDVLNVKLVPQDADVAAYAKAKGHYEMGASKDEVIAVQGTPNRISIVIDETWYYGKASSVTFNGTGKLTGYSNHNGELSLQTE